MQCSNTHEMVDFRILNYLFGNLKDFANYLQSKHCLILPNKKSKGFNAEYLKKLYLKEIIYITDKDQVCKYEKTGITKNQIYVEILQNLKPEQKLGIPLERLPDKQYLFSILMKLNPAHEFFKII